MSQWMWALRVGVKTWNPGFLLGGRLRFIEDKGRSAGSETITITENEILAGLNKTENFILAIIPMDGDSAEPHYLRRSFGKEPDFGAESINYNLKELVVVS